MRHCTNEKGIALVTALLLTLISLAIILAVVSLSNQGTRISALQKRYQTAREASNGGVEVVTKDIIPAAISGTLLSAVRTSLPSAYQSMISLNTAAFTNLDNCFQDKMTKATASWSSACTADNKSLDLKKTDNTNIADMTITLSGISPQPNFRVYAKIVDTVPGNTDTSGMSLLGGTGVVDSGSGIVTPQHFPYIYRIELQGERETNPDERSNLSVLYAY